MTAPLPSRRRRSDTGFTDLGPGLREAPTFVPEWRGYAVLDADGHLMCWASGHPRLHRLPELAEDLCEPGWRVVPICIDVQSLRIVADAARE